MTTKTHGGKRKGAGRPRVGKKNSVQYTISMPEEQWAKIDRDAKKAKLSRSAYIRKMMAG